MMNDKNRWEYLTRLMWASTDNEGAKDYFRLHWPGQEPKKYSPETMIPELNGLGADGWELVHMQPVGGIGNNRDIGFVAGELTPRWSNGYFCVFKRIRS